MANLHEVGEWSDGMWLSATAIDTVLKCTWAGEVIETWSPRNDPMCQDEFGLEPLVLPERGDPRIDRMHVNLNDSSHCHVNAVTVIDDRPHVLLNRHGAVVRLNPTEVVVRDATLRGCHNILPLPSGDLAIADTVNRAVRVYDAQGQLVARHDLTTDPEIGRLLASSRRMSLKSAIGKRLRRIPGIRRALRNFAIARPGFVRGLALLPDGDLLVGISPASLLKLDLGAGEIVDRFVLSNDVRHCIHGIAVRDGASGSID
jgi:hypothetical protein